MRDSDAAGPAAGHATAVVPPGAIAPRLVRELVTVRAMIALYCRKKHGPSGGPCPACQALADYATARLVGCVYGAAKPVCARCPVHCYAPARREEIRRVMRWAGPRMLLHHPWLALRHLVDRLRHAPAGRGRR